MIYSKLLSRYSEVFHGFTTKDESDQQFGNLVLAEQVHGNKISEVMKGDLGKKIKGADGLITKAHGVRIGVRTADCLPILFYEPKVKIVAAVHAGWQGILKRIEKEAVSKIEKLGGRARSLVAAIGPHIGSCCYTVPYSRVRLFEKEFGKGSGGISQKNGDFYLDLAQFALQDLLQSGIEKKNIEILPNCTSCQNNLFFSFRKEKNGNYGEMLSIIGLRE